MRLGQILGEKKVADLKEAVTLITAERWGEATDAARLEAMKVYLGNAGRIRRVARFVDAHGRRLVKDPMPGKSVIAEWISAHASAIMLQAPSTPRDALLKSAEDVFGFYSLKVSPKRLRDTFTAFLDKKVSAPAAQQR